MAAQLIAISPSNYLPHGDKGWRTCRATIPSPDACFYGLTREQYSHILSTFSHKSYPKAPELCLACFDELKSIGLEAFTQKHDPYWDIPLNEALPKPVIELLVGGGEGSEIRDQKSEVSKSGSKRRGRRAHGGEVREGAADYGPLFAKHHSQS